MKMESRGKIAKMEKVKGLRGGKNANWEKYAKLESAIVCELENTDSA